MCHTCCLSLHCKWQSTIRSSLFPKLLCSIMPVVGFMVRVVGLGSSVPEFKSYSNIELIAGGVDSACHPSEVGKMSISLVRLLSHSSIPCRSGDLSRIVPNSPGDWFGSTNALHRVWHGMEWNSMTWHGMEWHRMEWDGMEWNEME